MYFTYIIRSGRDSSFYIGSCADLTKRLVEHNFGRTGYTKYKRPWRLVYKEEFQDRSQARKRENYLKGLKNKKYLEYLMKKSIRSKGP